MKKAACFLLALALVLSLAACGAEPAVTTPAPATQGATAPVETTAPPIPAPTDDPVLLARRQAVLDAMVEMGSSFYWTVEEPLSYSLRSASTDVNEDLENYTYKKSVITLQPGTIYQGLPYSHALGSAHTFKDFLSEEPNEDGLYILSANSPLLNGGSATARISNSCSGAMQQAWGQVGNSFITTGTVNMVPKNGFLRVGEFAEDNPDSNENSDETVKKNGVVTMYRAYAQLQPGDAVVKHTASGAGHVMVISEVHYELNAKGNISTSSYVLVHHQTNSYIQYSKTVTDPATGRTVQPSMGLNDKRTFAELYADGYLPITMKELIDPSPVEEVWVKDSETQYTADNILAGTFTTNSMITSVRITVTAGDAVVQTGTLYGNHNHFQKFELARFATENPLTMLGSIDPAALPAGSYRCTHEALLPTGEWVTVRDYTFTK